MCLCVCVFHVLFHAALCVCVCVYTIFLKRFSQW